MTTIDQILDGIACDHLRLSVPTLDTRALDALDFHEVSVWALRDALRAAFDAGAASAEHAAADLVPEERRCPTCGERRVDRLVWRDDERVGCTRCGREYKP